MVWGRAAASHLFQFLQLVVLFWSLILVLLLLLASEDREVSACQMVTRHDICMLYYNLKPDKKSQVYYCTRSQLIFKIWRQQPTRTRGRRFANEALKIYIRKQQQQQPTTLLWHNGFQANFVQILLWKGSGQMASTSPSCTVVWIDYVHFYMMISGSAFRASGFLVFRQQKWTKIDIWPVCPVAGLNSIVINVDRRPFSRRQRQKRFWRTWRPLSSVTFSSSLCTKLCCTVEPFS